MKQTAPSKDRLIESATKEFAEKGLAGARIADIAARAGINKQLVYHYFGSKEALYSEALSHVLARSREPDKTLVLTDLDPEQALSAFLDHVVRSSLMDLEYQRLLLDANWHQARHIDAKWASVGQMTGRVGLLADILKRGAESGVFRDDLDPLEVYISIMGTLSIRQTNAYSLSKTLGADLLTQAGRERSQTIARDMFVRGISKR